LDTGAAIIISQFLGAILGAGLVAGTWSETMDQSAGIGMNVISDAVPAKSAWAGEIIMTYLLVTVLYQSGMNINAFTRSTRKDNPTLTPLALGVTYFVGHVLLMGIDRCCMNPSRAFGTAVVASGRFENTFTNFHVFLFAPLIGAIIAAGQELGVRKLNVLADAAKAAESGSIDLDKPLTPP